MLVINCDLQDVELYYYDAIFTLSAGDTIDLPFYDLSYENILEDNLFGISSEGSWEVVYNGEEIEIRSIDFNLSNDHEQKILGGIYNE